MLYRNQLFFDYSIQCLKRTIVAHVSVGLLFAIVRLCVLFVPAQYDTRQY